MYLFYYQNCPKSQEIKDKKPLTPWKNRKNSKKISALPGVSKEG